MSTPHFSREQFLNLCKLFLRETFFQEVSDRAYKSIIEAVLHREGDPDVTREIYIEFSSLVTDDNKPYFLNAITLEDFEEISDFGSHVDDVLIESEKTDFYRMLKRKNGFLKNERTRGES